jgi:flagellum-specific peptidoglycan hydrolase FlgJ
MNPANLVWLQNTAQEASVAGHIFAQMAACEAALESGWGASTLAKQGNNLFGMKQHAHAVYETLTLPTREFLSGQWQVVSANWVKYPSVAACFTDRMATLIRLRDVYPHYELALTAPDEYTYINEVSKTWSTDPERAAKVTAIFREYFLSGLI